MEETATMIETADPPRGVLAGRREGAGESPRGVNEEAVEGSPLDLDARRRKRRMRKRISRRSLLTVRPREVTRSPLRKLPRRSHHKSGGSDMYIF